MPNCLGRRKVAQHLGWLLLERSRAVIRNSNHASNYCAVTRAYRSCPPPVTYGPHVTCALIGMNCNALACARGWHSHTRCSRVRAATGLISKSWPRILRKGCSRYAFFRILSAVKRSTAEIQRSQTVKCLFALRSSGQAAKMTVKISWPRSQLWLRREWECHPLDARPAICNQLQHGYQECGCPSIIIGLIEN